MDRSLAEFELVVMAAVLRVGGDAYGVRIAEEIASRMNHEVSIGTLYRTLKRLEKVGYLSSEVGEPTPERGGRAKTFYSVTTAGRAVMRASVRELGSMLEGLRLGWGGSG